MHHALSALRCLGGRHTVQVNTILKLEDGRITTEEVPKSIEDIRRAKHT